jgi:3-methyladenine DNA glycosylase AlkD
MKPTLTLLQKCLRQQADVEKALFVKRFFKAEPGGYAAGDEFLGITVPVIRKLVKRHRDMALQDLQHVISSKYHEERLAGFFILVHQYQCAKNHSEQKVIYNFLIKNIKFINNWDLVDTVVPHIIGHHLHKQDRKILHQWANHESLWKRRISIISTFYFIRQNEFDDTLMIAKALLNDSADLIHKAVGWMLREVGKRNRIVEEKFLEKHYQKMPRTMLRYAIEHFPEKQRKDYLQGSV